MGGVREEWADARNIGQSHGDIRVECENIGRSRGIFDAVREYWMQSGNIGRSQGILDAVREYWTKSGNIGRSRDGVREESGRRLDKVAQCLSDHNLSKITNEIMKSLHITSTE